MIDHASMYPFALIIGQIGDHCNDKNFGAHDRYTLLFLEDIITRLEATVLFHNFT